MDELRVKVGILGLIMLALFSGLFMYMQHDAMQSAMDSSVEDGYHRSPEDFLPAFEENAGQWREAYDHIKACRYSEAFNAYGIAASFEYSLPGGDTIEVKPGKTAREVFLERKKAFAAAILKAFNKVVAEAVQKPLESWKFQEFAGFFMDANPEIRRLYDSKKQEIIAARVKESGKWFRLAFAPTDREYAEPVLAALQKNWNKKSGKHLVIGDVLDPRENESTWMILEVKFHTTGATYEVKSRLYNRVIPITVPESVSVSFNLKKRLQIPTTWDSLPPVHALELAPAMIREEYEGITGTVEKFASKQKAKLTEQIKAKLPVLPVFELYPGKSPDKLVLYSGTGINREAAHILGAVDPERLASEALVLSQKGDESLSSDLFQIAVEQDIDCLGEWAVGFIGQVDAAALPRLVEQLAPRTAFGGFGPILAILKRTSESKARQRIFEILQTYIHDEKVYLAFLKIVANRSDPDRIRVAALFFRNLPPDRLKTCESWIDDPDREFVNLIYQAITRSDSPLKDQAFGLMLIGSPVETQMNLLMNFHFNESQHGNDVIEKIKTVCVKASDARVRKLALEKLMYETAGNLHGWKALEEILPTITDPEMLKRAREALATNVGKADPAGAKAWQMTAMLNGSEEERVAAAHKFFRSENDIDEKLRLILPHLSRFLHEERFFEALLRGFSENGMSRLKNPESSEFREMLALAVANSRPMVRYFGYSLCHRGWSKGVLDLKTLLSDSLAKETDKWAKQQGENLLKAMK